MCPGRRFSLSGITCPWNSGTYRICPFRVQACCLKDGMLNARRLEGRWTGASVWLGAFRECCSCKVINSRGLPNWFLLFGAWLCKSSPDEEEESIGGRVMLELWCCSGGRATTIQARFETVCGLKPPKTTKRHVSVQMFVWKGHVLLKKKKRPC